jgi:hypothetical protein
VRRREANWSRAQVDDETVFEEKRQHDEHIENESDRSGVGRRLASRRGVTSVQLPSGADNPSRRRERGRAQDQDHADADRLSCDSLSAPTFIVLPVRRGDFGLVRHRNRSMPQAHKARRHKPVAGWRPRCTAS